MTRLVEDKEELFIPYGKILRNLLTMLLNPSISFDNAREYFQS